MPIHLADVVAPVVVAMLFIGATSAFKEPQRRHFNAIMIAGAGAAYLNGGLGLWEFVFTAVVTYCAYQGLNAYGFIGLGWLLHTGWDIIHHLYKPRQNIIYLSADLNRLCRIRGVLISLPLYAWLLTEMLHPGYRCDLIPTCNGNPIVPFVPTSSLGCAICDPIIAAWCFAGAPSVYGLATKQKRTQ